MTDEIKNEKFITNYIESDEFMDLTEEVACRRIDVRAAYQEGLKDKRDEFVKLMLESNPHLMVIMKLKPKERKPEEKEELKEAIKFYKNLFKVVLTWIYNPDKIKNALIKYAGIFQVLQGLQPTVKLGEKDPFIDFSQFFSEKMGIDLNFDTNFVADKLIDGDLVDNLRDNCETLRSIFDAGKTIKESINKEDEYEENEAFGGGVPENVKFSPENPTGLKIADFKKLVKNMVQVARGRKYGEIPNDKLEEKLEKSISDSENRISREDLIKRKLELDIEKSSFN